MRSIPAERARQGVPLFHVSYSKEQQGSTAARVVDHRACLMLAASVADESSERDAHRGTRQEAWDGTHAHGRRDGGHTLGRRGRASIVAEDTAAALGGSDELVPEGGRDVRHVRLRYGSPVSVPVGVQTQQFMKRYGGRGRTAIRQPSATQTGSPRFAIRETGRAAIP